MISVILTILAIESCLSWFLKKERLAAQSEEQRLLYLSSDLVHYEEQLVWECFAWLCGFALAQIVAAFLTAPSLGWGMIKESSWDKDLGVVLRGSMNQQGVVSTLLFLTIMSKLQVNLKGFDLTNNVGNLSSFDIIAAADPNAADYTFAEYALAQWYALSYMHTILNYGSPLRK